MEVQCSAKCAEGAWGGGARGDGAPQRIKALRRGLSQAEGGNSAEMRVASGSVLALMGLIT